MPYVRTCSVLWLADAYCWQMLTACISAQCTEKEASPQYVQSALDYALASLTPRVAANRPFLAEIQNSVDLLKQHLMCG